MIEIFADPGVARVALEPAGPHPLVREHPWVVVEGRHVTGTRWGEVIGSGAWRSSVDVSVPELQVDAGRGRVLPEALAQPCRLHAGRGGRGPCNLRGGRREGLALLQLRAAGEGPYYEIGRAHV